MGAGQMNRAGALRWCWLLAALLFATTTASAQTSGPASLPTLTAAEKAWLKEHPVIRIGVDPGYAPYAFFDHQGKFSGVAAEFAEIISAQLGIRMQVVPFDNWADILQAARERRIDVITTAAATADRLSFLSFTRLYIPTPLVIMTRGESRQIRRREDLAGHRVALVRDYSSSQRVLSEVAGIAPLLVDSPLAGLRDLAVGRADAYVGVLGVNMHLAAQHGIANLRVAAPFDLHTNGQSYGVRNDWPELTAILDKALDAIPDARKTAILSRWVPVDTAILQPKKYELNMAEAAWIARHPVVRVGVAQHDKPLSFVSANGVHQGLIAEYLSYITEKTGLVFEIRQFGDPLDLAASAANGAVDVVVADGMPAMLRSKFTMSAPLYSSYLALFQRQDRPSGTGLGQLSGRTVTIKDPVAVETLRTRYPELHFESMPSLQDALRAVADSRAEAAVAEVNAGFYTLDAGAFDNLKLTATVPYPRADYVLVVRQDWAELVAIIDRAVQAMPGDRQAEIRRTALEPPAVAGVSRTAVIRASAIITMIAAFTLGVFLWRGHKLNTGKIVAEERLRLALDAGHIGTFDWEIPKNRIIWSRWHEEMWGYRPGEFGGTFEAFAQRVHPEDLPDIEAEVARCIAARQMFISRFRVVWPDASVHWILARGEFSYGANRQPLRMRGVVLEITERVRIAAVLAAEKNVLEKIATDAPLEEILGTVAHVTESLHPSALCSVLLLDDDGIHVRHGAAPSLPASFNNAISGLPIGPHAGSCGTAAFRNERIIVRDIATDPLWTNYREIALEHGLRACWSTPINSGDGRVLGTFALYYRNVRTPDAEELALMDQLRHLASIAIERKRSEAALLRLEHIFRHAGWGMAIADPTSNRILSVNPAFAQMHGYTAEELEGCSLADTVAPESRPELPALAKAVNEVGHHIYESIHLRKDGSRFPCLTHVTAFKDTAGRTLFRAATFEDITAQKQAENALRASERTAAAQARQLRDLSRRLLIAQEEERRNINRELHDRMGQNLAAIKLSLNLIDRQLNHDASAEVVARLHDADLLAQATIAQVRDIMADLRPDAMDEYGLYAALRNHIKVIAQRLDMPVQLRGNDVEPRPPQEVEIALFRIAQEALLNAAKHARPCTVAVNLCIEDGNIRLEIADTGPGFDPEAAQGTPGHWGISTMRERAEAIGATLNICSKPGSGTRIICKIPIKST